MEVHVRLKLALMLKNKFSFETSDLFESIIFFLLFKIHFLADKVSLSTSALWTIWVGTTDTSSSQNEISYQLTV